MRWISALLAASLMLLALLTAAWRSEALEAGAANYRLEREIDTLERERDDARELVAMRKQPLAIRRRTEAPKPGVELAKVDKPDKKGAKPGAKKPAPKGAVSP